MSRIPMIYIAGSFRAPTLAQVKRNIDVASWFMAAIAELGAYPRCVHAEENLQLHDLQQENNGEFWLRATMQALEVCDAVVVVPGWHTSGGTYHEVQRALELGLPVFEACWTEDVGVMSLPTPARPKSWDAIKSLCGKPGNAYVGRYGKETQTFSQWLEEKWGIR